MINRSKIRKYQLCGILLPAMGSDDDPSFQDAPKTSTGNSVLVRGNQEELTLYITNWREKRLSSRQNNKNF